jgi:hypothetical protein
MFTDPEAVKTFVLAGNATVTLESEKTSKHFTYKVRKPWEDKDLWFVSLLTGPNNVDDFTYIGSIKNDAFCLTKKSALPPEAPSVAGFKYMCDWVSTKRMPPKMRIHHEGKCGRCGRPLTVPESVESGFGPECREILGL